MFRLSIDLYRVQGLGSWIGQALNRSNGKLPLRPRVVVHVVGTVVYVEYRGRLVGVRRTRAVREGGAIV